MKDLMTKLNLNENFICRIWEEHTFYEHLKTIDDKTVEIIDYGVKNHDSGPDYRDAKVKIDGVTFSGSIEIHRSSQDWYHHKHKGDNKYNDVVLHVAFFDDEEDLLAIPVVKKSRPVPTVILSRFLTKSIHEIWKDIINNPSQSFRLPCFPAVRNIPSYVFSEWMMAMSNERRNYKTLKIASRLDEITDNFYRSIYWEQVLFESICEALGYSKNKKQFLILASKVDLKKIRMLNLNLQQIDSLLFGLSGFTKDLRFKDPYLDELKSGWNDLKETIGKETMDKSEWNFFRLRPPNFPTVRIAYASGLLHEILFNNFFKKLIDKFEHSENLNSEIEQLFIRIKSSEYWERHYIFGKKSAKKIPKIGRERVSDIIVNVLIPFASLYSERFEKESLRNRVDYFYRKEIHEGKGNEVTRVMQEQLGTNVHSIADEQALIHLHNFYCVRGRCSECEIGRIVFGNESISEPMRIILY